MFYEYDVKKLISQWKKRASNSAYSDPYRVAVNECIFELDDFLSQMFDGEIEAREYLNQLEAEDYLSSIEAHDNIA